MVKVGGAWLSKKKKAPPPFHLLITPMIIKIEITNNYDYVSIKNVHLSGTLTLSRDNGSNSKR